ncbi:MAG TPA: hypothetical protein VK121_11130 [Pseudogracilibacillus sp.]|nr:hypothetical protein [Pseudogracilibacillus sp.]
MVKKKKERIELQFEPEKDADLLKFIDDNGTTRAGFIKHTLRHYMNSLQGINSAPQLKQETKTQSSTSKPKKKAPKLGNSFSSNDFKE